mmetsp:Transcript_19427/g.22502  ORF Transcript_19427/g.22502 Transcript_19427/m.22502 type:complete len:190 (+) Transcript_19427:71-640(+)
MRESHEAEEGYVKTAAHNYVSRQATIHGAKNVEMKGKSIIHNNAIIRGDLTNIRIGRYCQIGNNTIIRPPSYQISLNTEKEQIQFLPCLIGNHTRIGQNCVIEAAAIGSSVYISDRCVISKRVIIKDCCYIEKGTVIPPDMVIPPFSRVSGCPGKIVDDTILPESIAVIFVDECVKGFSQFVKQLEIQD